MFPGDDISRLLPSHVKSLADDLKKNPTDCSKWLYGSVAADVYQGDILDNFRIVVTDTEGDAVARTGPVIVMSHTCDAQPHQSEFVLLAPVFSLKERSDTSELGAEALENHLRDLRANRLTGFMFLPKIGTLPDSYADFSQVAAIASKHFHSCNVCNHRVAGLSQKGHYFLLMKVAFHFCRSDPPDSKREAKSPASTRLWRKLWNTVSRRR